MRKSLRMGFTMIELLIVIAVLGILAVAVLSAINPIEQINRSRDTGSRSDAEQLISAADRFYASKGYYPWQTSADDGQENVMNTLTNVDDGVSDVMNNTLNSLSNQTSELKASFIQRLIAAEANHLWIYNRGTPGDSTYVCFQPKSQAFMDEAHKRCNSTSGGTVGDSIPDDLDNVAVCQADAENTYSCLP